MLSKKINIFPFTALTLPSFSFQLKKGQKKHSGPTLSLKSSPMKRMFPNVRRLTWVSSSRRSFFFISSSSSCSEVHIKRAVVRDSQHSKFWLFWPPWQVKTIPRNKNLGNWQPIDLKKKIWKIYWCLVELSYTQMLVTTWSVLWLV